MEVEEEDAEDEDEDEDEEKQKQEQEQEQRNDEQVREDEEKRLEDERKEKQDIRNMVASYKRDTQRRNLKVETFLQQYFQPNPQDKIPASSCSFAAFAPTWLHILPAELLDDITSFPHLPTIVTTVFILNTRLNHSLVAGERSIMTEHWRSC